MPKPASPTKSVVAKKTCSDLASKVEKAVHAFNLWCQQCLHGDAAAHDKFAHAIKSFSTDWKCVFASGDKAEYSGIKDWFNYDLKVANDPLAKCHSSNFETIWENQDAILLSYDSEWSKKGVPTHTIYSAMWIKDKDAPHGVNPMNPVIPSNSAVGPPAVVFTPAMADASGGWQPRSEDLASLVLLFVRSSQGDSQVQAQLMQQLHSYASIADFPNYLAVIFALTTEAPGVRTVAGLTLKNTLRDSRGSLHPQVLEFVKATTLHALGDAEPIIRATSGTVITTLNKIDSRIWPDVVPKLLELIDMRVPALEEGAFLALRKICEDSCNELDEGDPQILSYMIQKLLHHMHNQNIKVRTAAVESLNQFILNRSDPLMTNINAFVASLYQLTTDVDKGMRRAICQALVLIFEVTPETVIPELNNVVSFMLFCTQDEEEKVALEASEFWLAFAEQENYRDHLEPFLPQIIPVLVKGMIYTNEEVMMLGGDEDDASVPDNIQDIKPHHHKSRNHANTPGSGQPKKDDDDDDDDYDDDDDDDVDNEWNVRKCSAAAVDVLATVFKEHLLEVLLPHLTQQLSSSDWLHREAGILALGAIAEGTLG
ncbi:hypothetical protein BDEG_23832 [Batrachochytrium dendrobatidis JEL423]|uniref:IPO4/5-like TPR repeats domain-containing protein n=1 Tax=Batrachochytrium dendrobatidis (strain JEL423) TaxID=403673 RepID=A0A177WIZ5_BATDL|nr:hypothetical protein BDEG_23832 [Batrachochytrium dendrobatidis JEL423]